MFSLSSRTTAFHHFLVVSCFLEDRALAFEARSDFNDVLDSVELLMAPQPFCNRNQNLKVFIDLLGEGPDFWFPDQESAVPVQRQASGLANR